MATRDITDSGAASPVSGPDYMDNTAGHLKVLLDKMHLPVPSPTGTNTYAGTVDPSFDADGLVSGMMFSIVWPNTNTSTTVTLNLNSEGATNIREFDGSTPAIGALVSGERALLVYTGTEFRMVAPSLAWMDANITPGANTPPTMQVYESSTTWSRPSGCVGVKVTCIAGGEGGYINGPGRGGGYASSYLDVTSISSSTVTVGAAGTGTSSSTAGAGGNGGDSSWADGTNTITAKAAPNSGSTGQIAFDPIDANDANHAIGGGGLNIPPDSAGAASGENGKGYGSGGAGRSSGTAGPGRQGVVIVEEFYS